jgi:Arylsulfotransferase (ASST)
MSDSPSQPVPARASRPSGSVTRIDAAKLLFRASLCLAFFGYGVVTVYFHLFPFSVLHNAHEALLALARTGGEDEFREPEEFKDLSPPAVRRYSAACGDELILVSGGQDYLKQQSSGYGCLAWIMNRQGWVKHVWQYDPKLWSKLDGVAVTPGRSAKIYPVGLHLYPDGGLLVSFQGWYTFPTGIGLARFDKDSKLLWKKEFHTHHWFSVAADGRIYALKSRVVDSPRPVGDTRFSLSSGAAKILEDAILILDPDGKVLDEIPLLDALVQSGWQGLLAARAGSDWDGAETCLIMDQDPTHLNGIQLVDAGLAAAHPWLRAGDLLLSMRSLNAVGILDPQTRQFKWMSAGTTVMQHSPLFYENGVLVFDNRGGSRATGGSRLVQVDLETHRSQVLFPRPSPALPGKFYTGVAGHLDLRGDGRVLVTLSKAQKIWEINLKTGEVLWEYICVDPDHRGRRELLTAEYVRKVSFRMNRETELVERQ